MLDFADERHMSGGGHPVSEQRFVDLWQRCAHREGATVEAAAPVYRELLSLYREPQRRYHTPEHIAHCLRQHAIAREAMEDPDAVEMALWFHDAIYAPGAPDNERRSADLFLERTQDTFDEALRRKVDDLIMATDHTRGPRTLDERFIVDIDLSSFGRPWPEFLRDSMAVREEFSYLSDAEFQRMQRPFLERLLARDRFCCTDFFAARHEARARHNIARLLDAMNGRAASHA